MNCPYPRCGIFANILINRLPELRDLTPGRTTMSIPRAAAHLTDLVLPKSRQRGRMLQRGQYQRDVEEWLLHFFLHCDTRAGTPLADVVRVNHGVACLVLREPNPPDTGTRHSADLIPDDALLSALPAGVPAPGSYRLTDLAYHLARAAVPTLHASHGASTGALWTAYRALLTRAALDPEAPRPPRVHFTPAARRGFRCEVS